MSKITKQLKGLKRITPSTQWQESCKEILMSQVTAQGMGTSRPGIMAGVIVYIQTGLRGAYQYTVGAVVMRPAALIVAVIAVLFGGSVASMNAHNSLPGDPLYSVKRTGETIQVALAPAPSKPEIQMELVEHRLQELDAISKQPISDEEKAQKVDAIVSDMSLTLSSAKQQLDDIKATQEPARVTEVASAVSEKAVKVEEALTKAKQTLPMPVQQNTASKVKEALSQAHSTNSKALAVVIEKSPSNTAPQDVKDNLQQRIQQVANKVDTVNKAVKIATETKAGTPEQVAKIAETSKEASDKLETAKKSLEKNDLNLALTVLDESYNLVNDAQDKADDIPTKDENTNSTTPTPDPKEQNNQQKSSDQSQEQKPTTSPEVKK